MDKMSSGTLYNVCFILIHALYSLIEYICDITNYVYGKLVDLCHGIKIIENKNKRVLTKLEILYKTPNHLTILLGKEEPSYKDLANIVIWCLATRITYISFYDYKGTLRKNQCELEHAINKIKKDEDHIIWHKDPNCFPKNGYSGKKIHIKILSEDCGRTSIVELTKKISRSKEKPNFSVENISNLLLKDFEFPDPDLGLFCGKDLIFNNYPPWQIRVTEFLNIKTHHNLPFEVFLDQLMRFSECEQRLGK